MKPILFLILVSCISLTGCIQKETSEQEIDSTRMISIQSADVTAKNFFQRAKLQQQLTGQDFLTLAPSPQLLANGLPDTLPNIYRNGDVYLFMGVGSKRKDQDITEEDYEELYAIMNYLTKSGFKVMINTMATVEHLQYAVENDTTSVIIWSSHGHETAFFDYNNEQVPFDIFANKSSSMYQFFLSSCYGQNAIDASYDIPADLQVIAWDDTTTSREMGRYLKSDKWSAFNGKRLGDVVNGKVCQMASEQRVYIHDVETGERLSDEPFNKRQDCFDALSN